MKKIMTVMLGMLLTCFMHAATAKPVAVSLYLEKIEAIKQFERYGDEVYMAITTFGKQDSSKDSASNTFHTVPRLPLYWTAKMLPNVKHVKLWEGTLASKGSLGMTISAIEHDQPPWVPDDLIGTVELKLMNKEGGLHTQWALPNLKAQKRGLSQETWGLRRFHFVGEGGEYAIELQLKQEQKKP